jgi:hypothetical protein
MARRHAVVGRVPAVPRILEDVRAAHDARPGEGRREHVRVPRHRESGEVLPGHSGDRVERVGLAVLTDHVVEERPELCAGERGRRVGDALHHGIEVEAARDVAGDVGELVVTLRRERSRRDLSEGRRSVELRLGRLPLRRTVVAGDRAGGLASDRQREDEKRRDALPLVQRPAGVDERPGTRILDEHRSGKHRRHVPVRGRLDGEARVFSGEARGRGNAPHPVARLEPPHRDGIRAEKVAGVLDDPIAELFPGDGRPGQHREIAEPSRDGRGGHPPGIDASFSACAQWIPSRHRRLPCKNRRQRCRF